MLALRAHLDDAPAPNSEAAIEARVLERAEEDRTRYLARLPVLERRADAVRDLALVTRILEAVRAVFRGPFAPKPGDVGPVGAQVDLFAADQVARSLELPRVGIATASSVVDAWTTDNVALIKTIDDRYFDSVERTILDGYRKGTSTREITAAIRDRYAVAQSDARRIARTEVAKLNGKVTEDRQTRLGITEYKWSTSHDERVRPDHKALDGKIFRWSDPPVADTRTGDRYNPGGGIQCRCVAVPVLPPQYAKVRAPARAAK